MQLDSFSSTKIRQLDNAAFQMIQKTLEAMRERGYSESLLTPNLTSDLSDWTLLNKSPIGSFWKGSLSKGFNAKCPKFIVAHTINLELDNRLWLHLSISKKTGTNTSLTIPDYHECAKIRKLFLKDKWSIQYFPTEAEYVNDANVLHFWHCLEYNPLPDFRKFGSI